MSGRTENATISQRILWIDIARGIAILSIVMSHVIRRGILSDYLGSVGVVLFFFLGGCVMRYPVGEDAETRKQAVRKYLSSRFRRLYLPYLAVGAFSIVVYALLGRAAAGALDISSGDTDLPRAFFHLLYANSKNGDMKWNDSLWFVPAYLVVLMLASGIEELLAGLGRRGYHFKSFGSRAALRCCAGALFLMVGAFLTQRSEMRLPWQIETACEMLSFYEAGVLYQECRGRKLKGEAVGQSVVQSFLPVIGILLAAASAMLTEYDIAPASDGLVLNAMSVRADLYPDFALSYAILAVAAAAFCLLAKGAERSRISSLLAHLGRCSMEIMLWNKFFVLAVQLLLKEALPRVYAMILTEATPAALVLSIPPALLCAGGCILLNAALHRLFTTVLNCSLRT